MRQSAHCPCHSLGRRARALPVHEDPRCARLPKGVMPNWMPSKTVTWLCLIMKQATLVKRRTSSGTSADCPGRSSGSRERVLPVQVYSGPAGQPKAALPAAGSGTVLCAPALLAAGAGGMAFQTAEAAPQQMLSFRLQVCSCH